MPITCLAVLDLGLPEGRSLGPTLGGREGPWAWLITSSLCWSRVHAPGLDLSLGAKVDSKQTPSQGKASSDRFDPGSFFLPCSWKGGLGEGNDVAQLRIGVGLGGALLPPHGRRRARSLDDGILVKLRGRLWVCHAWVTRSRLGPASRCLPSRRACWLVKARGSPPPPKGSGGGGHIPQEHLAEEEEEEEEEEQQQQQQGRSSRRSSRRSRSSSSRRREFNQRS